MRKPQEPVYTDPRCAAPEKGPRFVIIYKNARFRVLRIKDLFQLSSHGALDQAIKSGHAYYYETPDGKSLV